MFSKPLLTATRSLRFLWFLFLVRREGRNSIRVLLELHWFWFYIIYAFHLFIYDLCDKLHAWIDPPVTFRVHIGYEGLTQNIELLSCDIHHRIVLTACVLESWTRTLILESLGTMPSLGLFSELNSIELGLLETYESWFRNPSEHIFNPIVKLARSDIDRWSNRLIDRYCERGVDWYSYRIIDRHFLVTINESWDPRSRY